MADGVADNMEQVRLDLYANTRKDLLARQLSNSEKFDGAILTLSTTALGVSLAFIKDIVPIHNASCIACLVASWWLFGSAVVSTLLSFVASQFGVRVQLTHAEKYYLEGKDEYLQKRNIPAIATECFNYLSGILFISALVTTIAFVTQNL